LFVVDNFHGFQTNSSVHKINTIYKNLLQITSVSLAAIEGGAAYSAVKIFNKFLSRISGLKNDKIIVKFASRKYHTYVSFYRRNVSND